MTSVKSVFFLLILISYSSFVYAQSSSVDSLARRGAINHTIQNYELTLAGNAHVFNGVEYIDPFQKKILNGNPYFLTNEWQNGFVYYGDDLFENVSLRYNLFDSKLIIDHVQSHVPIELIAERVKYFSIANHTFVRLSVSNDQSETKNGFYELLYLGKSGVYVRRFKTFNEIIDQKTVVIKFTDKTKIFLFKDKKYYVITNKRSAMNAFGEDKPLIKKFLSQNKINFRSNAETALVAMAKYYDELKK